MFDRALTTPLIPGHFFWSVITSTMNESSKDSYGSYIESLI